MTDAEDSRLQRRETQFAGNSSDLSNNSKYIVTPWEVKGNIDYDKLISEFGVSKIDEALQKRIVKHTGELHHFIRRNIFFAHRDLNFILDEYEKGNKFFLYTGRAPSGPVHIGHLVPWMFTKWLQDKFDVELWFQFPDEEKFLFKEELDLKDTEKYLYENMLDVIALGFDPEKTHFIIDTKHAGLMYKEAIKVAKRITFSTVKAAFGFGNDQNIGAIFYTAMQAVPAFLPSVLRGKKMPCLIPHAIDQDPHFRVSRDVIPKLGYYKPASIQCRFLPGLGGMAEDGKMSSSSGETATIFTTDDPKTVKKKINKYAFSGGQPTVEEHRKLGGNPDIDVSYQWLTFFEEDDAKLVDIYNKYKSGEMLSGELKAILIEKLNSFLETHQKKREEAKKRVDEFIYSG
ncbi:MAG: tryptophan--tRNA ligase [Candidatus Micrarchaeota archaeon]|nr:tryptophan--tRNA ligase [Candidatus Micrarchaeota archaeon]